MDHIYVLKLHLGTKAGEPLVAGHAKEEGRKEKKNTGMQRHL